MRVGRLILTAAAAALALSACGGDDGGSSGLPSCADWAKDAPAPGDVADGCEDGDTIHLWVTQTCADGGVLAYSDWGWGKTPDPFVEWADDTPRDERFPPSEAGAACNG